MSVTGWVRCEAHESGVRVLTLDRPPVNALGRAMVDELTRSFGALAEDPAGRCLVLRSAGKHFCAGADLKERREMDPDEVRRFVPKLSQMCDALAAVPFPTIAAVRGAAVGGGCELLLACDLRIMAEDVTVGLREAALAIIPGAGGTQRLPRIIGPARAKLWIFTARMHTAAEALEAGLSDRTVAVDDLDRETVELAETIAANGPIAVRQAKRAIDEGAQRSLDEALKLEWECYQQTLQSDDRVEALDAFAEKRPPRYQGR